MATLTRRRALAIAAAWWLVAPIVEAIHYFENAARGAYAPGADSIMIPISQFAIGWLVVTPLFVAALWWAGRAAPLAFGWSALDRTRPVRAGLAGLLALLWAAESLRTGWLGARDAHWGDVFHGALGLAAALAVRALASAPRVRTPQEAPSRAG